MNQTAPKLDIKISTANTKYKVLRYVAKSLNWKTTKSEENWNVMWFDSTISPLFLCKMSPYQRVNHFPGMYAIARKSNLCMNLNKLRKRLPSDFSFYPQTWFLPSEFHEFDEYSQKNPGIFILKPSASSQGKGIFIITSSNQVNSLNDYIVQQYIEHPLLIDGLKFDMRIYVLITSCDPLKIFIHKEGLARFATEKYQKPAPWNMEKVCMHLTNYSLNKLNPKFVKNNDETEDNKGHKRSLSATLNELKLKGFDTSRMWKQVSDLVIKTLLTIQPSLAHTYRSCRPGDLANTMCFEILGFDVILDKNFRPWLLEVNHSPSFETSSPLDKKIKTKVIADSLKLLGLHPDDKRVFEHRNKIMIAQRSVFRKSFHEKLNDFNIEKEINELERQDFEENNLGGFFKAFPKDSECYRKILNCSQKILQEFTNGKKDVKKRSATNGRISITPQPQQRMNSVEKSPYKLDVTKNTLQRKLKQKPFK